jgi:hypothetical protein
MDGQGENQVLLTRDELQQIIGAQEVAHLWALPQVLRLHRALKRP